MDQTQIKQIIQKNRENLIKFLGLSDLAQEKQDAIMDRVMESVYRQVIFEAVDKLSEDEARELIEITEKDDIEQVYIYLDKKLENFDEFMAKVTYRVIGRFKALAIQGKKSN